MTTSPARLLMLQGTASGVGKSLMVAALGRALHRRGMQVAPFKPQNMALNSAVTAGGAEIGRAQALQALACGREPHSDMNPILLKPTAERSAQLIVHGRARAQLSAAQYHRRKRRLLPEVLAACARLRAAADLVLVEGAGSPAEINLRDQDLANMGFATATACPVVIVADIDRGGVFAHIIGTLELLQPDERALVCGFIINRFRGDPALLAPGLQWLARRTGLPVFGVVPYLPDLWLDAEDAPDHRQPPAAADALRVLVPQLPRISNHTDFDALRAEPGVHLHFASGGQPLPAADLIVLPGSKNVRADLAWLRAQGWDGCIDRHLQGGGRIMGICGGYQMLGAEIADPDGAEHDAGTSPGLGLLPVRTLMHRRKHLAQASGQLRTPDGTTAVVRGYYIHCGQTSGQAAPLLRLADGTAEGAIGGDGAVLGTAMHGIFDRAGARRALLRWAGHRGPVQAQDQDDRREAALERLADCAEQNLQLDLLLQAASAGPAAASPAASPAASAGPAAASPAASAGAAASAITSANPAASPAVSASTIASAAASAGAAASAITSPAASPAASASPARCTN